MITRLRNRWQRHKRQRVFERSLRHLHGPEQMEIAPGEVLVIALLRDGSYYLDDFFEYYRGLGLKHFAFFDNGSRDESLARIKAEPGTVVDGSDLPLGQFEDLMRAYPAQRYGAGRWCLYVDMDEQFDFAGRAELGMPGLLAYLEGAGHTAMAVQMLEMFPKAPLGEVAQMPFAQALQAFCHYDLSAVRWAEYHSDAIPFHALMAQNQLADPGVRFAFGGVRGKVFGENCCLTKHPLVFNGPGVRIAPHPHVSCGLHVSDVMGVIRHYKFTNDPLLRDLAEQASGVLDHGENAARAAKMQTGDVTLYSEEAEEWAGVGPLYEAGFIRKSEAFDRSVEAAR
ncbi:MAG: glycosyltransferase family 2 protein [Sulfitobacter sp.]